MSEIPVTEHFTIDEFACHSGEPYPIDRLDDDGRAWMQTRLLPLCQVLESLRASFGARPIRVLSGYRTPSYNAGLRGDGSGSGVAQDSQHVQGRAADVTVDGATPAEVHAQVLRLVERRIVPQLGGLGVYPGWCHLDVRPQVPAGHLARWIGK